MDHIFIAFLLFKKAPLRKPVTPRTKLLATLMAGPKTSREFVTIIMHYSLTIFSPCWFRISRVNEAKLLDTNLIQSFQLGRTLQQTRKCLGFKTLGASRPSIRRHSFTDCRANLRTTLTIAGKKLNGVSLQLMWQDSKIIKSQSCSPMYIKRGTCGGKKKLKSGRKNMLKKT